MPPGIGYGLLAGPPRFPGMLDMASKPNANLQLRPTFQPPERRSKLSGLTDALGMLFTGQADPRLSDEQNKQARNMALIQGGLAAVMAAQQPGASALGSLAQGAMYGQQAGQQGREAAMQQAMQQNMGNQYAAVFSGQGDTRSQLHEAFKLAVQSGDTDAMRSIMAVLQAVEASEGRNTLPQAPARGTPEWFEMRRRELELEREYGPVRAPVAGTPEFYEDLRRRAEIAAEFRPAPRTASGTEGERKAAAFLEFVPDAASFMDTVMGAPGRVEQALSDKGIGEFTDEEQQRLQLAGNAMAEAWLRMTTGAAYNDREFANAYNLFVPRPGDKKATLDEKKRMRQKLIRMLRTQAGRLGQPQESDEDFMLGDDNPYMGL